jgi:hypothetical protein
MEDKGNKPASVKKKEEEPLTTLDNGIANSVPEAKKMSTSSIRNRQ